MVMDTKKSIKEIPDLVLEKKLSFFFGSGTSVPGMPLMSEFTKGEKIEVNRLLWEIRIRNSCLIGDFKHARGLNSYTIDYLIPESLNSYINFVSTLVSLMNMSNSRQGHKVTNLFTTNYDLFIEQAANCLLDGHRKFIFNDGSQGYFSRILDSANFDTTTAYKGRFDNYLNEIPVINIVKPHGSVNWKKVDDSIEITNYIISNSEVVNPDGNEPKNTLLQRHYYDMFRFFEYEMSLPESVLLVHGFSFGDDHVLKMFNRALENTRLLIIVIAYSDEAAEEIESKFGINRNVSFSQLNNLYIIKPSDLSKDSSLRLALPQLTQLISGEKVEA